MRRAVTLDRLTTLMQRLAAESKGPGNIYFTGGASLLLWGIRGQTVDVDLKLDPEPLGVFEAIARIKNELDVNIELASPDDFIPVPSDWRERSVFIECFGGVNFFHFDPRAQVLAKIERGFEQDLSDCQAILKLGATTPEEIRSAFCEIRTSLIRYPALNSSEFENKIARFFANRASHDSQ